MYQVAAVVDGGEAARSARVTAEVPCAFQVTPLRRDVLWTAGAEQVAVTTAPGCAWTAASGRVWQPAPLLRRDGRTSRTMAPSGGSLERHGVDTRFGLDPLLDHVAVGAIAREWAEGVTRRIRAMSTMPKMLRHHEIAAAPPGFRSSFRDWAAERTDHPREVIEAALAHVVQNKVEAPYARSDLFERRRLLMDKWSAYLAGDTGSRASRRARATGRAAPPASLQS